MYSVVRIILVSQSRYGATRPCSASCITFLLVSMPDETAGTSEEELSCGEVDAPETQEYSFGSCPGDQELKEMLLRKYSGYLNNLMKAFLKKKKRGKLPKDARMALMDWWNTHCRWPYPTVNST